MKRIFPLTFALGLLFAVACACVAAPAAAQPYPTRPVTLLANFGAGGAADFAARSFALQLSERLGQSVVVDNRVGASGKIGTLALARAPADGYTLLFTPQTPITIADSVDTKLGYNAAQDFVPVMLTHLSPVMVVVPAGVPARTLNELAALSRSSPGKMFFGSSGTGGELHLVAEWVKREVRLDMTHVPYKGTPPALTDLIAGRVQMLIASPASVSQYLAEGQLRAIAVLSQRRLPGFPDVPTSVESGYPELLADGWFGVFALAATPPAVLARLEKEAAAIAAQPAYQKQIADRGMIAAALGPKEFREIIQRNRRVWRDLIPSLNLSEDTFK